MPIWAQMHPPAILQIYREPLTPGSAAAFGQVEEEAARICAELKCPHPYLGIESLTGPPEVWFLNGYESAAEQKQVVDDYARNAKLLEALNQNAKRRAGLTREPVEVFAKYRPDISRGASWSVGQGRFLVISVTKGIPKIDGSAFEAQDGARFVFAPAHAREEADAKAKAAGGETYIFAVRPDWSMPAKEWVNADPEFWTAR